MPLSLAFFCLFFFLKWPLCFHWSLNTLPYIIVSRQVSLLSQASLKLSTSLPQPPKNWDCRCGPPHPVPNYIFLISLSRSEGSLVKEIVLFTFVSPLPQSCSYLRPYESKVSRTHPPFLKHTATSACFSPFPFCLHWSAVRLQETSSTWILLPASLFSTFLAPSTSLLLSPALSFVTGIVVLPHTHTSPHPQKKQRVWPRESTVGCETSQSPLCRQVGSMPGAQMSSPVLGRALTLLHIERPQAWLCSWKAGLKGHERATLCAASRIQSQWEPVQSPSHVAITDTLWASCIG